MKVAILGAALTGKTELCLALSKFLQTHHIQIEIVDCPDIQAIVSKDVVLLCGLDLASSTDTQSNQDQEIRGGLRKQGLAFQVVYGQGSERLQNALFCLANHMPQWASTLRRLDLPARWTGLCENCGDGLCEHQLFTQLVSHTP
jgi:hypothetical protein